MRHSLLCTFFFSNPEPTKEEILAESEKVEKTETPKIEKIEKIKKEKIEKNKNTYICIFIFIVKKKMKPIKYKVLYDKRIRIRK